MGILNRSHFRHDKVQGTATPKTSPMGDEIEDGTISTMAATYLTTSKDTAFNNKYNGKQHTQCEPILFDKTSFDDDITFYARFIRQLQNSVSCTRRLCRRYRCFHQDRSIVFLNATILALCLFVFCIGITKISFEYGRRSTINPPSTMRIAGREASYYSQIPEESVHTFFIEEETPFRKVMIRAFRNRGFRKANSAEMAHYIWDKRQNSTRYEKLQPWQRYNYIPGFGSWDRKDSFARGLQSYYNSHPKIPRMIPETYQLHNVQDRQRFAERLEVKNGGLDHPWVLKETDINNGDGIEMLGPRSPELTYLLEDIPVEPEKGDSEFIVQSYICNELTWWGNHKFDLRFYWLVASIDPLIVMYHDGYVRVGNSVYNETDWTTTRQHLTTHTYLADEDKGTVDRLIVRLQDHFQTHQTDLQDRIIRHENGNSHNFRIQDPWQHVRNQMKQSIAHTIAAFHNDTFGNAKGLPRIRAENGYAMNGADFVIDNDLDVWYVESQAGPGLEEEYDFRVELHRDLWRTTIDIIDEIQTKNQQGKPLLPLASAGGWEVVYSETQSKDQSWMYEYENYQRVSEKKSCQVPTK